MAHLQKLEFRGNIKKTLWELCQLVIVDIPANK